MTRHLFMCKAIHYFCFVPAYDTHCPKLLISYTPTVYDFNLVDYFISIKWSSSGVCDGTISPPLPAVIVTVFPEFHSKSKTNSACIPFQGSHHSYLSIKNICQSFSRVCMVTMTLIDIIMLGSVLHTSSMLGPPGRLGW